METFLWNYLTTVLQSCSIYFHVFYSNVISLSNDFCLCPNCLFAWDLCSWIFSGCNFHFPGNLFHVLRTGNSNNWIWEWVVRLIDEIVVVQLTMYQLVFCGVWKVRRCLCCLMHTRSYEFYHFPFVCFNSPHILLY